MLQNAARHSRFGTIADSVGNSALVAIGRSIAAFILSVSRNSLIYRWLTKEPEPEVIVIDLRETWSVGPFIRTIDRGQTILQPYYSRSRLKYTIDRYISAAETFADRPIFHRLRRFLAPPTAEDPTEEQE